MLISDLHEAAAENNLIDNLEAIRSEIVEVQILIALIDDQEAQGTTDKSDALKF